MVPNSNERKIMNERVSYLLSKYSRSFKEHLYF